MERLICCGETFPLIIQLTVTAVDTAIVMMVSAGFYQCFSVMLSQFAIFTFIDIDIDILC